MKNLKDFKTFERLSPDTYREASDELRKSGQIKRARDMDIHAGNMDNKDLIGKKIPITYESSGKLFNTIATLTNIKVDDYKILFIYFETEVPDLDKKWYSPKKNKKIRFSFEIFEEKDKLEAKVYLHHVKFVDRKVANEFLTILDHIYQNNSRFRKMMSDKFDELPKKGESLDWKKLMDIRKLYY